MNNTDILVIAGPERHDAELVAAAGAHRPRRVTVLIEARDPSWASSDATEATARRDRLARLLTAVACTTGATVVGLVGDPTRLELRGFDAIVRDDSLLHAA
jgi:hypothetical protein